MAERICRTVSSSSSTVCWIRRWTAGSVLRRSVALQLQTGGEQPLDDVVVQIAGDPVPVGEHVELALGPVLLPQLERERGLLGERGQQRHLARFERGSVRPRRSATSTPITTSWE